MTASVGFSSTGVLIAGKKNTTVVPNPGCKFDLRTIEIMPVKDADSASNALQLQIVNERILKISRATSDATKSLEYIFTAEELPIAR